MRDGQDCVRVRVRAIDAALYWRYRRANFAFVMALPIGLDKRRCLERSGMMVPVLFYPEALPHTPSGAVWGTPVHRAHAVPGGAAPIASPGSVGSAGGSHGCALDAIGRISYTVKECFTAVEEQWEKVVRRLQGVCLGHGRGPRTASARVRPMGEAGNPPSPPALAIHATCTRVGAEMGPRLECIGTALVT